MRGPPATTISRRDCFGARRSAAGGGNVGDTVRAEVHAAARALRLPATDARLIAIGCYVEPLAYGHDVHRQLAAHAAAGVTDPVTAWILGHAANTVGAYDFAITWTTEASTAFREQGRLGHLARTLFFAQLR